MKPFLLFSSSSFPIHHLILIRGKDCKVLKDLVYTLHEVQMHQWTVVTKLMMLPKCLVSQVTEADHLYYKLLQTMLERELHPDIPHLIKTIKLARGTVPKLAACVIGNCCLVVLKSSMWSSHCCLHSRIN